MRRKMAWGISALLLLTSCAGNGTEKQENTAPQPTELTTSVHEIEKQTTETASGADTVTQADEVQTINFDKFSLQIPADFKGITDETASPYDTPSLYQTELPNGEKVFFGWGLEGMYPADSGKFDETANDIAERHREMCFGFENEETEYVWQNPYFLDDAESKEVMAKECQFVHQTGTMKRDGTEQPVYCYEAYFGNIPYKNRAFNIDHAPAFWIAFADSQNEGAKEYIHTLIEQVTDSFSY